jgi:hypothetical protein
VVVFGLNRSGAPFIEGYARILATTAEANFYLLRFAGERVARTRFVNPDWRQSAERSLTLLREFLRTGDRPQFEDFFFPEQDV